MTNDTDFSDFVYHGFEGIESSFTNISVVRKSSHNILLKARRYGQWWLLKGLLPEEKDEPVFQEMLRKEFEILIQLQHPNIVRAFSIERVEEWGTCIVMEWVEGDTLLEYMKTAPDNQKKLKLVGEMSEALRYIHQIGIVHRDLKPSNVMVTRNGDNVKLIDFGLADSDNYAVLKQSGGTESYMAPEQAAGGDPDCRNDIYSLGVILQQMNLGKRFEGIVKKCQAPFDRRYKNMDDFKTAFDQAARRRSRRVSSKWLWLMGGLVLLLLGVTGYSLYRMKKVQDANSDDPTIMDYEDYVPSELTLSEEPTLKIVNPDFHGGKAYGWSFGGGVPPDCFNKGTITAAHYYMKTFNIWQVVHGLEPGDYELSVQAFHRPDSGHWTLWHYEHAKDKENGTVYSTAELYADTASVRLLNWATEANTVSLPPDDIFYEEVVKDEIPSALAGAGYYFQQGHYVNRLKFKVGEIDSVKIGLRLTTMRDTSFSWVAFDTFRLKKLD